MPTTQEIAVRAQELKAIHLALSLSFTSVLDPAMPVLAMELRRMGLPPDGDFPVNLFDGEGGPDKECLSFSARQIFTAATSVRGEAVWNLISISMINTAIVIADMIQKGGHSSTSVPLLQFARHFRNAAGHGDTWNYDASGPPYPAACRELVLTGAHVGRRATWETVSPRLFVEFLDDITEHFSLGLVPPPTREP